MTDSVSNAPAGFARFGLHEFLERGIEAAGFDSPRPIQAAAIPAGLEGRDVLGLAMTGTGKTAAFALPLLDRLLDRRQKGIRALVLAPTRELATQIAAEIRTLSQFTPLKVVTLFGGVPQHRQISQLHLRPEIIVGCPGRVLDLIQQGELRFDRVETLVIDEADHLFDMGFLPDIKRILGTLPARRQNLLFSATMPKEVRHLADNLLRDPLVVELAHSAPATTVDHALVLVREHRKRDLLEHVLANDDCDSAIVFTRTKHRAKRLADQLSKAGYRAIGLQGNLSQPQRDRAMAGFRARRYDILVATDIVARGIDVSGVSHVINFDVPNTPDAYTHRIGRTGRAELEGRACTFVTGDDLGWVRATERMIGAAIPRRRFAGFDADGIDPSQPPKQTRPARGSQGEHRSNAQRAAGGRQSQGGRASAGQQSQGGRASGGGRSGDGRGPAGPPSLDRGTQGGQRQRSRRTPAGRRRTHRR